MLSSKLLVLRPLAVASTKVSAKYAAETLAIADKLQGYIELDPYDPARQQVSVAL